MQAIELLQNCHPEPVEGQLYLVQPWIRQAHHDNLYHFAIVLRKK